MSVLNSTFLNGEAAAIGRVVPVSGHATDVALHARTPFAPAAVTPPTGAAV